MTRERQAKREFDEDLSSCLLPFIWTLPTTVRLSEPFASLSLILQQRFSAKALIIKRLKQVDPFFINHLTTVKTRALNL